MQEHDWEIDEQAKQAKTEHETLAQCSGFFA